MTLICYIERNFSASSQKMIEQANVIIREYQAQGFVLTVRQIYYQFVARGLLANKMSEYKKLASVINDARLAGLISWQAIEDRTRFMRETPYWDSPGSLLEVCADTYAIDKWRGQEWRPEVWIEKDALIGVIEPICNELQIAYFACRGYNSQSEQWTAGQRIGRRYRRGRQRTLVLHFGDHDPSGLDMTADNTKRLAMFCGDESFELRRLALNMNQVEEFNPPPNPAKTTDSRAEKYIAEFGDDSWELDALEPAFIAETIRSNVASVRDDDLWAESVEREDAGRKLFIDLVEQYKDWEPE